VRFNDANSTPSVQTFSYQFGPPGIGKTLNDCDSAADFPFYIMRRPPMPPIELGDVLRIRITDSPRVDLTQIAPTVNQWTEVDMKWTFNTYAVWLFPDDTAYPVGRLDWQIHWSGRLAYGRLTAETPLEYFWEAGPSNLNDLPDRFVRDNNTPILQLPNAKSVLNGAQAGFQ
jgi:hypothetical protein